MTCSKCGSENVNTTYHQYRYECCQNWNLKTEANEEHLHKRCGDCGYDWTVDCIGKETL